MYILHMERAHCTETDSRRGPYPGSKGIEMRYMESYTVDMLIVTFAYWG